MRRHGDIWCVEQVSQMGSGLRGLVRLDGRVARVGQTEEDIVLLRNLVCSFTSKENSLKENAQLEICLIHKIK